MTDETGRPEDERPEDLRADRAEDGGHLRDEAPVATATDDGDAFRRRERRGIVVPVVAAAIVAALIGGGVGAGITLAVQPDHSVVASSTGSNSGVVINNPKTATAVSAIAAKASPSVVTISVNTSSESGTGSGIVLTSDGDVLTNNHVVTLDGESATGTISVTTSDGHVYKASVVKTDPLNDLAVIKLQGATGLTPATWGDSADLNVGDQVVAIGAPLDLPNTVTTGIVSALDRSIAVASSAVPNGGSQEDQGQGESPFNFWNFGEGQQQQQTQQTTNIYLSVLQTDAAINPGNSGGALVDSQGRVIGVNVAIAGTGSTSSGQQSGSIGLGFSIPSNIAKRIATDLMDGKTPTHGQLGVESTTDASATAGSVAGAPVARVTANGPAAKAGIRAGDVITAVGGVAVTDYSDLAGQVRSYAGGSSVSVTYSRDGSSHTVQVTLGSISASSD